MPIVFASAMLGLMHALSFSLDWPQVFGTQFAWLGALLSLLSLAGLFSILLRHRNKTVLATLTFCVCFYSAGLAWLYISMNRYGGMPGAMAATAVVLLAIYLSSFYAVGAKAATVAAQRFGGLAHALLLAGAWSLAELLRGYLFTGFPWLALGYSAIDTPLATLAPYSGVYCIGLVMALLAGAFALLIVSPHHEPNSRLIAVATIVLITALCTLLSVKQNQTDTHQNEPPLSVSLIQGNVAQDIKFDRDRTLNNMVSYVQAISRSNAQLIVLPETAWTIPWPNTPEELIAPIKAKAASSVVAIGVPIVEKGMLANSMVVIGTQGQPTYRYDKSHLVPFGEFVPFGFDWFVRMMSVPLSNFSSGGNEQALLKVGKDLIAFNICYEDIFGEEIRLAVSRGATVLINASNIAWFGDSHALYQHLQMARMRALETARPMLRATNTGVTAHIAADGSVQSSLAYFTAGTLNVSVQGSTHITHYVKNGNYPVLFLSLLVAALGYGLAKRKKSSS